MKPPLNRYSHISFELLLPIHYLLSSLTSLRNYYHLLHF